MSRRLIVALILVPALLAIAWVAQPARALTIYTVNGHVTDSGNGQPVQGVCIIIGPPSGCAPSAPITNASGNWSTQLISGSAWDVWYSKTGYNLEKDVIPASQAADLQLNHVLTNTGAPPPAGCAAASANIATRTVYLPNITKTLGGPSGWVTPFIVQNTGAVVTTLEVSFYRFSDGSCVARRTVNNLAAGTSFADIPNNDSDLPGDTQFSVVVRSFGANVVSTVNQVQGSGASAQGLAYTGASAGAATVYLPNVTRRFYGWDIPFIIQNLSTTSTTTSATASFTSLASPTCTTAHTFAKAVSIDAGRSKVIDPDFEATYSGIAGSGLIDGCQYSVTITSAQPIAVVANAHNESGAPAAYSHNALASGATTLWAPYAATGGPGGIFSPVVVQNVGASTVNATLEFTPLGGGVARSFVLSTIAAGTSKPFDPRYGNGDVAQPLCAGASTTCLGAGEYSLKITSVGPVAAVVLPVKSTTAAAYTASLNATTRVFLPNITRTLGGSAGWSTPIYLQSATATGASLRWYRFSDGSLVTTQTLTLTPGSSMRIDPRTVAGLSEDTQYAVVADGTGGTITAIVHEQATGGDSDMIYEGFPGP